MSLLGATMVSVKSKSGRHWYVRQFSATMDHYVLVPLGDDVRPAQVDGKFQGGVRRLFVPYERLNDPKFWRPALDRCEAAVTGEHWWLRLLDGGRRCYLCGTREAPDA